ncbi:MAG: hypothetical protein OEY23_02115 [Acidimicrobiia bacterium]|nr:hypothetical protein [Acidimicrobiia bacterium]
MKRSRRPKAKSKRAQRQVLVKFWGDPEAAHAVLDEPLTVRPSVDAAAVVRSLGPPPLPGHERQAEHYFAAVYDKAVGMASALAAAGGLLDEGGDDDQAEEAS